MRSGFRIGQRGSEPTEMFSPEVGEEVLYGVESIGVDHE
jgi:hypothetical protein